MKFAFFKTSDHKVKVINVSTLSELMNLVDAAGEIVVGKYYFGNDPDNDPDYFIEDYDDYRE